MASNLFKELKRRNVYKVATVYAITAWLITQVMSITTDAFGAPDWVMKTLIIVLIIGFPVALILAWAYELSPEGLRRTTESSPEKRREKKKFSYNTWIIGLLLLALVLLGVERVFFAESTFAAEKHSSENKASIAVLPFADFSPKGDQEYFADGISEEILNVLAKIKGLDVAGRTSSFQFKNKNRDLKAIADSLGVDHILEGSVRKAGDQLRITAQLIRADNGFHVWTETYDRSYSAENIFKIQDDISQQVLEQLKVRLLNSEDKEQNQKRTTNTEAYRLFLKATSIESSYNPADIKKAIKLYDEAIKLDPKFALAYARKAKALTWLTYFGNLPYKEMSEKTRNASDWALLLDHEIADTYAAIGLLKWQEDKFEQSVAAFDVAKSIAPGDAEIRAERAMPLLEMEKMDEALQELEYAYRLDPYSPLVIVNFGWHYFYRDEFEKAKKLFQRSIEVRPDLLAGYDGLIYLNLTSSELDRALIISYDSMRKIKSENPVNYLTFIDIAAELEMENLVKRSLYQLQSKFPNNISFFRAKYDWLIQQKSYQDAIDFTNEFVKRTGGIAKEEHIESVVKAFLALGKYQKALEIIEENYPEALEPEELEKGTVNFTIAQYAALALLNTGEKEKAKSILETTCNFVSNHLEKKKSMKDESYKLDLVACSSLLGNKKPAKEFLRNRLKNGEIENHHHIFGLFNELFMNFSPQELQPYKQAEEKILREQRQNVITYLKKEGEWQEEWEL